MRHPLLTASVALALGVCAQPSSAALPPGISGAWYNPDQSGHGLSVEILDDERALAFWFVYDPAGNPVHLYLEGRVVGEQIAADAYLSRGMRFGEFDPADHEFTRWGTVVLAFESCTEAQLSWTADGPAGAGFVDGAMPLTRLSAIAGLECELGGKEGIADPGQYTLEYPSAVFLGNNEWVAAVDASGQVWATPTRTPAGSYVGPIAPVITGSPMAVPEFLRLTLRSNGAVSSGTGTVHDETEVQVRQVQGRDAFGGSFPTIQPDEMFAFNEVSADPLERSFDTAELAGRTFVWNGRSQFFDHENTIRFFADGSFCVDTQSFDCVFEGQLGAAEPGLAMFAFSGTAYPGTASATHYSGMGWLEPDGSGGERVALVGIADAGPRREAGLGVVGVEQ